MSRFKSRAAPLLLLMLALARGHPECGGTFTAVRGVLQTPGFPKPFPVPIHCKWIIDASHLSTDKTSIVVYLTQLFVFGGLTFTDYVFYDRNFPVMGKSDNSSANQSRRLLTRRSGRDLCKYGSSKRAPGDGRLE